MTNCEHFTLEGEKEWEKNSVPAIHRSPLFQLEELPGTVKEITSSSDLRQLFKILL